MKGITFQNLQRAGTVLNPRFIERRAAFVKHFTAVDHDLARKIASGDI